MISQNNPSQLKEKVNGTYNAYQGLWHSEDKSL